MESPKSWSTGFVAPEPTVEARPGSSRRRTGASRRPDLRGWLLRLRPWLSAALGVAVLATSNLPSSQSPATSGWRGGTPVLEVGVEGSRPTPQAPAPQPLGVPRLAPADSGSYKFLHLQPSSGDPVAYDPCRPVPYVVNERTAPPGAELFVRDAVREMQDITGLQFEYEGTTDEVTRVPRPAFQPERYGDRWAPVLITWSDPAEIPDLDGTIAGVGGSTAVSAGDRGPVAYVSGIVALDGPQMGQMFRVSHRGRLQARAVVLHELGHLLGLDHVDDKAQLMHGTAATVDLQSGDRAGLALLGAGPCVPDL